MIHVPHDAPVLAMDVHKNTISAGVLEEGATSPVIDKISSDYEMVRRLVARSPSHAGCGRGCRLPPLRLCSMGTCRYRNSAGKQTRTP